MSIRYKGTPCEYLEKWREQRFVKKKKRLWSSREWSKRETDRERQRDKQ